MMQIITLCLHGLYSCEDSGGLGTFKTSKLQLPIRADAGEADRVLARANPASRSKRFTNGGTEPENHPPRNQKEYTGIKMITRRLTDSDVKYK